MVDFVALLLLEILDAHAVQQPHISKSSDRESSYPRLHSLPESNRVLELSSLFGWARQETSYASKELT